MDTILRGSQMKRNLILSSIVIAVFVLLAGYLSAAEVKLQVLNPRGAITFPPVSAPSARIADLAGKKIGLYWNGKAGGDHFWNEIERQLREKLPKTEVVRYQGAFDLGDALAARITKETDAFFYGVGD
jgi:hypothetical protein